jgi:predicted amidophosphoribosyltransferase
MCVVPLLDALRDSSGDSVRDPVRNSVGSSVRNSVRDLARLLVPVACPGCGLPDVRWCAPCAAPFAGPLLRVEDDVPRLDRLDGVAPLPVWALTRYEGPVRGVVVGWKDRGRADLDTLLVPAAARGATGLRPVLTAALGPGSGSGSGPDPRTGRAPARLLVVPAPSSGAARRERGRDHLSALTRAVARAVGGVPAPVLRRVHVGVQVGLGARGRGGNVVVRLDARAFARARDRACASVRRVALLLDDVVTTGATLAAAERALEEAGVGVVGALALAATPPPAQTAAMPAAAPTVEATPVPAGSQVRIGRFRADS